MHPESVRASFERLRSPLRRFAFLIALMVAVQLFGTLAFRWVEGWSFFDGFYMTLMTLTTVGYGEVHPLTPAGRVVAAALMMAGVAVVFVSIGVTVDLIVKLELTDYFGERRKKRMLDNLKNHYIVCGAGRVGRSVIRELKRSGAEIVLIESDTQRAQWGIQLGILTIAGNATQDETLRRARVDTATGLVAAISSDAENVYVILSARGLNPNLVISARATDEQAEDKLRRAGANTVFTPYTFIGHRLAQSLLRPHVVNFLDVASAFTGGADMDIETEQVQIDATSPIAGKSLEASQIRQVYGVIVMAVKKPSGTMIFNPAGETIVETNDVLIAMGERAQLQRLGRELNP